MKNLFVRFIREEEGQDLIVLAPVRPYRSRVYRCDDGTGGRHQRDLRRDRPEARRRACRHPSSARHAGEHPRRVISYCKQRDLCRNETG